MSFVERQRCLHAFFTNEFQALWDDLWINHRHKLYKYEYNRCKHSFFKNMNEWVHLFQNDDDRHNPWGFFKGRLHYGETGLKCGLREFMEESTVNSNEVHVIDTQPLIEEYRGTDDNYYKTVYHIAYIGYQPTIKCRRREGQLRPYLISDEVENLVWASYLQCTEMLNDGTAGSLARLNVIREANDLLLFQPHFRKYLRRRYSR
jgi:hypothetical protein